MAKKQIIILIILGLIAGALGGILFDRVLITHLSQVRGFGWITRYAANAPIVITRNEQVVLNEGVNLIELAKKTSNITVSIYRKSRAPLNFMGQGTIMTADGLIFSSRNVVGTAGEVIVALSDGTVHQGLVRALDPKTDLAVVTIEAKNLAVAGFDQSLDLQAGQRVVTVGVANREFDRRLNAGIITSTVLNNKSLNQIFSSEKLTDSFSTNLIFDGNFAGNPVVNLDGKLVAIIANEEGDMIVSENLKPALDSYLQTGKITRARLGLHYVYLSSLHSQLKNLAKPGVLVTGLDPKSPASKVLQINDLIFEIDGESLKDKSFEQFLNKRKEGQVKVKLLRAGKELEVTINLEPTK